MKKRFSLGEKDNVWPTESACNGEKRIVSE